MDSVEIAKERVAQRVKKGGHTIDEKIIERRFKKSLDNFKKVIPLCNKMFAFDNSQDKMKLVKMLSCHV